MAGKMFRRQMDVLNVLEREGPLKRKVIGERIGITSGYLDDILANLHWQGRVYPERETWHLVPQEALKPLQRRIYQEKARVAEPWYQGRQP